MDLKEIGKKLKLERQKRKISQIQLAEMVDISSVHLSHIENGRVSMSLECMLEICNALSTTPNYILMNEYETPKEDNAAYLEEYFSKLTKDEYSFIIEMARTLSEMRLNSQK